LAEELGIYTFTEAENEKLKGVSRMASLDIILQLGGLKLGQAEKEALANRKNNWNLEYLETLTEDDVLPGVLSLLEEIETAGLKIGLGSASKNAELIIDKVGIRHFFNALVDGNKTINAKPDPEVFLKCAKELETPPQYCVVFEDAQAGIEAATRAGMSVIGIGDEEVLRGGDKIVPNFKVMNLAYLAEVLHSS
jgi:beta-phosphoglucomutase